MAAAPAVPVVAFRVSLSSLIAVRTDGVPEDDFKTFAQATVLTRGRPNATLWYASESDIQLAKTSVGRLGVLTDYESNAVSCRGNR